MDAAATPRHTCLLGDLGGTNARFALAEVSPDGFEIGKARSLRALAHRGPVEAALAYLQEVGRPDDLREAVIACAGPVELGLATLTNLDWKVSSVGLEQALGLERALLLNDLEAVGWSAPALGPKDLHPLGGLRTGAPDGALAVVGAGTGFNASACLRAGGRETVMVGEIGHASFAPTDDLEMEVVRRLTLRFGRVSIERLVSGPGILNLYQTLCEIQASAPGCGTAEEVSVKAADGDPRAKAAIDLFCGLLGAVAGDIALAYGARGGVYIAGGIAPGLLGPLGSGAFRRRFEAKGRFQPYMALIPTCVIVHPHAALLGAARARAGIAA